MSAKAAPIDIDVVAEEILKAFDGQRTGDVQEVLRRALELSGQRSYLKTSSAEEPG